MTSSTTTPSLADIRREYGQLSLDEETIALSPFVQFEQWFADALQEEVDDPTAMVLSTVDAEGRPDARVILLKGMEAESFLFYTNYDSAKAHEIMQNTAVALTFYWPKLARQVRIRGQVERISAEQSDAYFATRPRLSQLSALVSQQSQEIKGRLQLEPCMQALEREYQDKNIPRPAYWGGYAVKPDSLEFWQGRDCRLHDRIVYVKQGDQWITHRLAP